MINNSLNNIKNLILFNKVFTQLQIYFIKFGSRLLFSDRHLIAYEPKIKDVDNFLKLKFVSYESNYHITEKKNNHNNSCYMNLFYIIKNPNDYMDVVYPRSLTDGYSDSEFKATGFYLKLRFDLYSYILNRNNYYDEKVLCDTRVKLRILVQKKGGKDKIGSLNKINYDNDYLLSSSMLLYNDSQLRNHSYYMHTYDKFCSLIESKEKELINWTKFYPIACRDFIMKIENIIRTRSIDIINTKNNKNRIVVSLEEYDTYSRRFLYDES